MEGKYPNDDYWEPRNPIKQYEVGVFEADYTGTTCKYEWLSLDRDMIAVKKASDQELKELAPYCCCFVCELYEKAQNPSLGWVEWAELRIRARFSCRGCFGCIKGGDHHGYQSAADIRDARQKRLDAINK